jgi:phospholipid/cholesterol/gamma-HCH transport system permease protein
MGHSTLSFTGLFRLLGRRTITVLRETGSVSIFIALALRRIFTRGQLSKVFAQVRLIGSNSMFLIFIISLFTGLVLGLQGYHVLTDFGSEGALGSLVSLALVRELGPVLAAIMITGRAGSAMAAEIGVMRISDQLDALEVMDIDPTSYLVSPRIAASLIVFPLLTAIFNVVGIIGGYLTGFIVNDSNMGIYFSRVQASLGVDDVAGSFIKSMVFAVIVSSVSCYKGFFAHTRTDGVGPAAVNNATTSAVVTSCILILISDYMITSLLM